jgi:hypothetical protein
MAMKTVWFWKGPSLDQRWSLVRNYSGDEHPKPSTVESDSPPTESKHLSSVSLCDDGHLSVDLNDDQFDGSPQMWYALEESDNPVEMVAVHGIVSDLFSPGCVVDLKDAVQAGLRPADRAGFIRWFRKDSRMQQIYTSPEWRRRRVSTVLIAVADIVIVSGGYGPHLNGGDVTTEDGEKLREAWAGSPRVSPRIGSVLPYES